MKSKAHYMRVRFVFDKSCTKAHALREVRDCLNVQQFYTTCWDYGDPEEFHIRGVKGSPEPKLVKGAYHP